MSRPSRALLKTEGQLPCGVLFLLEGEEESGGDALARYVSQAKDELKPDAVVISDSTMYDANTPAITYGLRGIIALEFIIRGPPSDVHSGAYGGGIANPAMVLAQILATCVSPRRQGPDPALLRRRGAPAGLGAGELPQAELRRRRPWRRN